ncbi:MAG: polyphosphate kinase 2 (PPK2 family) [Glaciecola sp.]|jgi:polyphosphate kinase 2 (PPK2 family)
MPRKQTFCIFFALEGQPEFQALQVEFFRLQSSFQKNGKRLLIIFDGPDAAGKGSALMPSSMS